MSFRRLQHSLLSREITEEVDNIAHAHKTIWKLAPTKGGKVFKEADKDCSVVDGDIMSVNVAGIKTSLL